MPPLTYDRLLELGRAAEGRELETVTGRKLTLGMSSEASRSDRPDSHDV